MTANVCILCVPQGHQSNHALCQFHHSPALLDTWATEIGHRFDRCMLQSSNLAIQCKRYKHTCCAFTQKRSTSPISQHPAQSSAVVRPMRADDQHRRSAASNQARPPAAQATEPAQPLPPASDNRLVPSAQKLAIRQPSCRHCRSCCHPPAQASPSFPAQIRALLSNLAQARILPREGRTTW